MSHEPKENRISWQDLAMPAVLLVTGMLLVGFDQLGWVSLDKIQNLWPTVFILTGLAELAPAGETRR